MNLGSLLRFDGLVFERLAAALLHFVWQGALVALAYAAADRLFRRRSAPSNVRYALACGSLAAMLLLPIATFVRSGTKVSVDRTAPAMSSAPAGPALDVDHGNRDGQGRTGTPVILIPAAWRGWLLGFWLAGVAALSLRFLAGCAGVARIAASASDEAESAIQNAFSRLRERLGVSPGVRLLRSAAVDVPAALGVLRPIVLLPVSALTGLDGRQIEALLAHELAHVRRHDYLVNLLQCVVETLLFYHPAVWWISGRIRVERENACDDLAVAATGDARVYAGALVGLEELRAGARRLAVAANGGHLRSRVLRLFPTYGSAPSAADARSRRAAGGLALCALVVVGAAAWIGPVDGGDDPVLSLPTAPAPPQPPRAPAVSASASVPAPPAPGAPPAHPAAAARAMEVAEAGAPPVPAAPSAPQAPALPAASVTAAPPAPVAPPAPLSDDELSLLRSRGVTPRFVQGLAELGYARASVSELVALRTHGVSAEDIAEYQKIFGRISLERCVTLKSRGASPRWLGEIAKAFAEKISPDDAISLRTHGVDADFIARFREAGYPALTLDEAVSARIHGVDPSQAAALAAGGARPSLEDLTSARIHGVDADFAREIRAEFPAAKLEDLVSFRIHGVTGAFVSEMKRLGLSPLSADEAVALRVHGVTPEYVREMKAAGVKGVDVDGATQLRIHGVPGDFARAMKADGYSALSVDDLTSLRIHGWTLEDVRKANRAAGRRLSVDELLDGDMDRRFSR